MSQPARLRIDLKPSRRLAGLLIAAYLLAAATVLALPGPVWARLAAIGAIAFGLVPPLRRHALLIAPTSCVALDVHQDGTAKCLQRSGSMVDGQVLGDTFVNPLLTVVRLRRAEDGRRDSIVLLPDSAQADALRALRVWLRFKVQAR
jgi:toxin CptA